MENTVDTPDMTDRSFMPQVMKSMEKEALSSMEWHMEECMFFHADSVCCCLLGRNLTRYIDHFVLNVLT